jgi:predicted nucleotidyltransferase
MKKKQTTKMVSPGDRRKQITAKILDLLNRDARVNFVLATGSTAENKENELSDVDLCVVMKDDAGLNQILREVNILFSRVGKLVGYYQYSPYHFYLVYQPLTLVDIYIISSSIYFIIRNDGNKKVVDHGKREVASSDALQPIIHELFLRGWTRTFRLLSKIRKTDYVTLVYILNQIREEQLIPLLSMIQGHKIPHAKAVKLSDFNERTRDLFIQTFRGPTAEGALSSVKALAGLFNDLFVPAAKSYNLDDLAPLAKSVYQKVIDFE